MSPKDVHVPFSGTLHGKRDLASVIKVKDLEMGMLFYIIQVGPIQSHKSLQAKSLPQPNQGGST